MKYLLSFALAMLALGAATPPALPTLTAKKVARPAAKVMTPKATGNAIVKTAIALPAVAPLIFTNSLHFVYYPNIPIDLELLWYTDDNGNTWHHKPPMLFSTNDVILPDSSAPAMRWYLLTYTIQATNHP